MAKYGIIENRVLKIDGVEFTSNSITRYAFDQPIYVQGSPVLTGLSWVQLVNSWTAEPTLNTTIPSGEVYDYTYGSTVYYRLVPDPYDPTQDTFYTTFNDPTLSGAVATRGEAI